jgi:predicted  nucleic acid-binding Zn-ribbon protein
MTESSHEAFDRLVQRLRTDRDELKVRLHLASREIQDEWRELEEKWQHIEPKLAALKDKTKTSAHDIGEATREVSNEIGKAYQRLKKSLKG